MILLLLAALVLLTGGGVALFALYLAESFTRSKRRRVQGTPEDLGLRYEEIQFLTADRLTLRGWFMESPGARATMIIVHDVGGTRADQQQGLLELQRDYVRRGYNVFSFDLRGHGESSGRRDSLGARQRLDVQAAVAYVRRRCVGLPILLHGFGLGGSLAISAAAAGVEVSAVIADSPIASMRHYLRDRHQQLPQALFDLACVLARRWFDADVDELEPIARMDQVAVPVLLIHGEEDARVPVSHTLNLAAASLDPRDEVWVSPDVEHCAGYRRHPDAYLGHCLQFVDQVIPARLIAAHAG